MKKPNIPDKEIALAIIRLEELVELKKFKNKGIAEVKLNAMKATSKDDIGYGAEVDKAIETAVEILKFYYPLIKDWKGLSHYVYHNLYFY